MMRNKLNKIAQGSTSNERSSGMRPEPCDQKPMEPNAENKYEEWLINHPSALSSFKEMISIAKGKKIAMFLDYDGTLSNIVDNPELAFMTEEMRAALREIAVHFPTTIITGRSCDKVYDFVKLDEVYYTGSHGMDIKTPPRRKMSGDGEEGNSVNFQPAQGFLPEIQKIIEELEEVTKDIKGITIEDNRYCVSVHYRMAEEKLHSQVKQIVTEVLKKHSRFHHTSGNMVWEIRPSIEWNKGNALNYLLDTLGYAKSSDALPIYIGDDGTDEDAFEIIQKRGQGFPILVSKNPKETRASYSLRDTSEVLDFLLGLAKWRKNMS